MSPVTPPRRLRTAIGATAAATLAVAGIVATANGSSASEAARAAAPAPAAVAIRGADSPTAIAGSYVVVLAGSRSAAATRATTQSLATSYDAKVR
jgi:hypothetical protein